MRRPPPASFAVHRAPPRRWPGPAPDGGHPAARLLIIVVALGGALSFASGCGELRGRRNIREGNRLYREGHYAEAVAAYSAAEPLVPGLPHLWLNKGIACRQMMVPGGQTPENARAVDCAIDAFEHLRKVKPSDQRGEQLYLQTLFDADRFEALVAFYRQRLAQNPSDLAAVNGLVQVFSRWNRMEEALEWYRRRAALEPNDAQAQYSVGVFLWQELFKKGGGPEKAAFDPRAGAVAADPSPRGKRARRAQAKMSKLAAKPTPPTFGLGDITGSQRAALADLGISYLEKAVALRPKYREAMVYLNLLYRQKSFAYLEDPVRWQAAVDAADKWRRQVDAETPNPSPKPPSTPPSKPPSTPPSTPPSP